MIVTIKTLQQKTFKVEIEDSELVKALKEKIEQEKGDEFPAAHLKLIYGGKILDDAKPLTAYKIQPNNFVVVMVSKPRAPPPKKPAEEASEATPTGEETSTSQQESPDVATETTTQPPAVETPSSGGSETTPSQPPVADGNQSGSVLQQAGSTLVTGDRLEETIATLMEHGYSRERVERALNASFYNPDRAAEMLFEGTDEALSAENVPAPGQLGEQPSRDNPPPSQPAPAQQPAGQQQSGGQQQPAVQPPPAAGGNPLGFLRDQPQFQQLVRLIQAQPANLPEIMQAIHVTNPQLFQLIQNHRDDFLELIREAAGGGGEQEGGPQATHIPVTPEEKAAIDRLMGLGNFSEADVIQVYFACEKNEELAANVLFSEYS